MLKILLVSLLLYDSVSAYFQRPANLVRRNSLLARSSTTMHLDVSIEGRLSAFIIDCIPIVVEDHFRSINEKADSDKITSDEKKIIRWRTQLKNSSAVFFESLITDCSAIIKSSPIFIDKEMFRFTVEEAKFSWIANQTLVDCIASMYLPEVKDGEIVLLVNEAARKFYFTFPSSLENLVSESKGKPFIGKVITSDLWTDDKSEVVSKLEISTRKIEALVDFKDLVQADCDLHDNQESYMLLIDSYTSKAGNWVKGINLSKLKKTVRSDPLYFKRIRGSN